MKRSSRLSAATVSVTALAKLSKPESEMRASLAALAQRRLLRLFESNNTLFAGPV